MDRERRMFILQSNKIHTFNYEKSVTEKGFIFNLEFNKHLQKNTFEANYILFFLKKKLYHFTLNRINFFNPNSIK